MADPDPRDDTSADYEQSEKSLLAQDRDVADTTARNLVSELVDGDVVTPVIESATGSGNQRRTTAG